MENAGHLKIVGCCNFTEAKSREVYTVLPDKGLPVYLKGKKKERKKKTKMNDVCNKTAPVTSLGTRPSKNRKGGSGISAGVEVYTAPGMQAHFRLAFD